VRLIHLFIVVIFTSGGLIAQHGDDYASSLMQQRKVMVSQLLANPRSPLDATTIRNVRFYEPNDSFLFETIFLPLTDTATLNFATSSGEEKQYRPYAKVFFRFGGSMHQLTLYESIKFRNHPLFGDKLFLPFWDETNSESTYGGGRYLDISKANLDSGNFQLDFNKAYNPWCAYGDGFSCPVPPTDNRLSFAVRAGEKDFVKSVSQ